VPSGYTVLLAVTMLRSQVLVGATVALAGRGDAVGDLLARLGARVQRLGELPTDGDRPGDWSRLHPCQALVFDASEAFGKGGQGGLRATGEQAWAAVYEVATGSLIAAEQPGKIVLIGPRPNSGPFAEAARAALENLARTLATEWARHRVTVTMIAPGAGTADAQVAELVCYLISPGGDYFSGCRFSLEG
jgi:hypothetical protein